VFKKLVTKGKLSKKQIVQKLMEICGNNPGELSALEQDF
jgi:hypothetical protein